MSDLKSVLSQFIGDRNASRLPARLGNVVGFPDRIGSRPPLNLIVINADGSMGLNSSFTYGRTSSAMVQDYAGVYKSLAAGYPRIQGARYSGNTPYITLEDTTPLHPTRTASDGATYCDTYPTWRANTAYALNARVIPSTNSGGTAGGDGYWYYASTGGTSHATTEPTWAEGPVSDGTAAWTRGGYYRIGGYLHELAEVNSLLYCIDYSNGAWVKEAAGTGSIPTVTMAAGVAPDGTTTAVRVEFSRGASGVGEQSRIRQAISLTNRTLKLWIKSNTGSSQVIHINLNSGGTSYAKTVTTSWSVVSVTDAVVNGIRIGLFDDTGAELTADVLLWVSQLSDSALLRSPIITTSAAVTRSADSLTLPLTMHSDTQGSLLVDVQDMSWTTTSGKVFGDGTEYVLGLAANNSGARAYDGTNTVTGPTGTPAGTMRQAVRWAGSVLQVAANGTAGTAGSYDGSFNLANLTLCVAFNGLIRRFVSYATDVGAAALATLSGKESS